MNSVKNNIFAMNASRNLNITTGRKAKDAEKLSSGYRINRAADDAAGLSISEKMRKQIRGLSQGVDNSGDGISLCQVGDAALAEVHDMLHRITQLSIQSANGTMSDLERQDIQGEVAQLVSEIGRIGETTTFNGIHIFDIAGKTKEELVQMDLIRSPSADAGYMSEIYKDGSQYYPAVTMDFSAINAISVRKLYGKSFSFGCSQSCSETFKFTFINGNGSQSSVSNRWGTTTHEYTIDIHGLTSGSQVLSAIFDYVCANPPGPSSTSPYVPNGNRIQVSHSNYLIKQDSQHFVMRSTTGYTSEQGAQNQIDSSYADPNRPNSGKVDFAEVTGSSETRITNIFPIQYGAENGEAMELEIERMNTDILGITVLDVSTVAGCNDAIDRTKEALETINRQRSKIGVQQNRLEHTIANEDNVVENTTAAESRLRDMDMAKGMVSYSMVSILQQVGQSMLAQANKSNQSVINLLS
jgi:Flagellin and related hook-associated proteins